MARLSSWAETCEVSTANLVCNLAARKPWPHPKGIGAAELGKHPVEIGHDGIEVRFAPMSRRLGPDPDVPPCDARAISRCGNRARHHNLAIWNGR